MRISKNKLFFVVVALITHLSCTNENAYTCKDISENYYDFLDHTKQGNDPSILIPKLKKILKKNLLVFMPIFF